MGTIPIDPTPQSRLDFYNFSRDDLSRLFVERLGLSAYRATQVFEWVYRKRTTDFVRMTNIGAKVQQLLSELFVFSDLRMTQRRVSADGSRKYLFEVDRDRHGRESLVESVMIKQPTRMTLCVSSQVGCGMGCSFCRTGEMGFRRHLSSSEIVRQVLAVIADAENFGDSFQNIVFMGMGEPLHNFDAVVAALRILRDQHGLSIPGRKITVSSVGLVPAIERFGALGLDINLAVSLNATTDEVRNRVMPVNRAYPLALLTDCLRNYPLRGRRVITIEYVLLSGVNDGDDDIRRLPRLLNGIRCKVNLIPYNANAGLGFESPARERIFHWQRALAASGLDTTIRWSKGQDIHAACGQLATSAGLARESLQAISQAL